MMLRRIAAVCALAIGVAAFAAGPEPAIAYPISLATALRLADAQAIDISIAAKRIEAAAAAYDRSKLLWLPNLLIGGDYTRHDGQIQDIRGDVFGTSRSAVFAGVGPNLNVQVSEAWFAPLAARQDVRARIADRQTNVNDTMLSVADAYFNAQQARGELLVAPTILTAAEELSRKAEGLAQGLAPPLEATRARTELARRRQAIALLRERQSVANAELCRTLRLPAATPIAPAEPPDLLVTLIDPSKTVDDLIPIGLTHRPELANRQAIVAATIARLKQEKLRPLTPSVLFRGVSTTNPGLAGGVFGGGINSDSRNYSARSDWDVQIVWELQNLGFGNAARVRERRAEHEVALLEVFRTQDRVAAEVAQAVAQVESARGRITDAASAFNEAQDLVAKSLEGLGQIRRSGELLILIVRPSEVVAAVQSLAQAATDYYAVAGDYNRAQFRLYRALGQPGECLPPQIDSFTPAR